MDASRDIQTIQTGGGPDTLAALVGGSVEAAALVAPGAAAAVSRGYRYIINGPDLRIPYGATTIVTLRSLIAKRNAVLGRFMRVMAEAATILHTDKAFVYKVLGKYMRLSDTKILDSAYSPKFRPSNAGWRSMRPRCSHRWMRSRPSTREQRPSSQRI